MRKVTERDTENTVIENAAFQTILVCSVHWSCIRQWAI